MANPVLVCSSDETAAAFLTKLLNERGVNAVGSPASSAASAVIQHDPALVIVDSGLEPVRSIRALADPKQAAVSIVVLGPEHDDSSGTSSEAIAAGANHFVGRPVIDATLVTGVRTILSSL